MIELTLNSAIIIFIVGFAVRFYRFKKKDGFLNLEKTNKYDLNIKEFLLNLFLQTKLFKAGKVRWVFHFGLLLSFIYLLIVHGLHAITADFFFNGYESTLDPFQFLRNMSGLFVLIAGIAFVVRRSLNLRINQDKGIKKKGLISVIAILVLIGSGFALEASKIISEPIFMEMVEEYSDIEDEELIDLKLYWKENYTVFFEQTFQSMPNQLQNGEILNEEYCLYCHSNVRSAFLSKTLAKAIYSAGQLFNANRLDKKFYWIHYGICLILLICLPFSRIGHIILIPFASSRQNLKAIDYQENRVSINVATLYACTNCGFCSQVCSVYPSFQISNNPDILPHSKIESVKTLIENPSEIDLLKLSAGNGACTSCYKCTDICPSGIDLQSLWTVLDKKLVQMDIVDNNKLVNDLSLNQWISKELTPSPEMNSNYLTTNLADRIESFGNCIQCTICSNVCPIVDYDSNEIDMSPHQIMNLLRLGKKHLATGTRMVWTCLTCYACQENCPQGIQVTDILLELRNVGNLKADMIQKNRLTEKADQ